MFNRYTKFKIGRPRKYLFLNVFNHSFILMTMLIVVLKKWKIQIFLCNSNLSNTSKVLLKSRVLGKLLD